MPTPCANTRQNWSQLAPDVILAHSSAAVAPLLQATRTIPIVFTLVADPVGAGFVESLARPGGNATGFTNFEYSMGGKWLELLKEISPRLTRVAVLRESAIAAGPGQFGAIQAVAQSLGVELRPIDVRDAGEIERDITAFAQGPNGGLIVTGSPAATVHRDLIVALAARHRLPAIYNSRFYVTGGGLISYGPDFVDQFRRAAGYVDRILKGEKPADLPVQAPTKYELVDQSQDRQGARPRHSADAACPRRRGDRINFRSRRAPHNDPIKLDRIMVQLFMLDRIFSPRRRAAAKRGGTANRYPLRRKMLLSGFGLIWPYTSGRYD